MFTQPPRALSPDNIQTSSDRSTPVRAFLNQSKTNQRAELELLPENDLSTDNRSQHLSLNKDPSYQRFVHAVEKNLQTFEYVTEWADITAFLAKLSRAFEAFENFNIIPEKIIVSKRLAQCLNPALPTGVHQKALSIYQQIFVQIGIHQLDADLRLYATGLYSFIRNASIVTKIQAIEILKVSILPVVLSNPEHLASFLVAVLSGFEEDKSEVTLNCLSVLKQLQNEMESETFFSSLIYVLLESTLDRENTLKYLIQSLPNISSNSELERKIGKNVDVIVKGICHSLGDDSLLVVRAALDLLIAKFPLNKKIVKSAHVLELMKSSSQVILRKDMSLNRRLYSWWLSNNEDLSTQKEYFQKNTVYWLSEMFKGWFCHLSNKSIEFSQQLTPIRILSALMDKFIVSQPLIDLILLTVIKSFTIKKIDTSNGYLKFDNRTDQAARNLFQSIDTRTLLSQLTVLLYQKIPARVNVEFGFDACSETDAGADSDAGAMISDNKSTFQSYVDDVEIFYAFTSNYLPEDRKSQSIHLPLLALALVSTASSLSQSFPSQSSCAAVALLLDTSALIVNMIPEEAMTLDFVSLGAYQNTGKTSELVDLVKNHYNVEYNLSLLQIYSITSLTKHLMNELPNRIDIKLEIGSNSTNPTNLPIVLLNEIKKVIFFSKLANESLDCACSLVKKLVKYGLANYGSFEPANSFQSDEGLSGSKGTNKEKFKNCYIETLVNTAIISNDFSRVKCTVDTIVNLIVYRHDIAKSFLLETCSPTGIDLQENKDSYSSTPIELIVGNIWRFMSEDSSVEASSVLDRLSMVFSDRLISEIISKRYLSSSFLSIEYIRLFTNFWSAHYRQKSTLKGSSSTDRLPKNIKSIPRYLSLLTNTLSSVLRFYNRRDTLSNMNQITGWAVNSSYSSNKYVIAEISEWVRSGISLESLLDPILTSLHFFSIDYILLPPFNDRNASIKSTYGYFNIHNTISTPASVENLIYYITLAQGVLSLFHNQAITLLESDVGEVSWLEPFPNRANFQLNSKSPQIVQNGIKNGELKNVEESESLEQSSTQSLADASILTHHSSVYNLLVSENSTALKSYIDLIIYTILPLLESTIPDDLLIEDTLNPDTAKTFNSYCNYKNEHRLSLQMAALGVLHCLLTMDPKCSRIKLSPDSLGAILSVLVKIYYTVSVSFIHSKVGGGTTLSTEDLVLNKCQVILTSIVNVSQKGCNCETCSKSAQIIKLNKANGKAVASLFSSAFLSEALLHSFPTVLFPAQPDSAKNSVIFFSWHDLVIALCDLQAKNLSGSSRDKPKLESYSSGAFTAIFLPLLNLVSESLFISSEITLNARFFFKAMGHTTAFDESADKIVSLLIVYGKLISMCLTYPALVVPIDGMSSSLVSTYLSNEIWEHCDLLFSSCDGDESHLLRACLCKHAEKLQTEYSLSLTYCVSILIHIWDKIILLNTESPRKGQKTQTTLLRQKPLNKTSSEKKFILLKICNQASKIMQNLWSVDSSELAMALGDLFEHNNSCWISLIFSPANFLKLSLNSEMLHNTGTAQNRNSIDSVPLHHSLARDFKSDTPRAFRSSTVNSSRGTNYSSPVLTDSELKAYSSLVKDTFNVKKIYDSLNFLDILENYIPSNSSKNPYVGDSNKAIKTSFLFVSCLIDRAAERIQNALENGSTRQNSLYNQPKQQGKPSSGYMKFSDLSDVGLLRLIEIILETRCLSLLNFNYLGIYSSPFLDGDEILDSRIYNTSRSFDNSFEIVSIVTSTISLFNLVNTQEIVEKPWMPFVSRACLSIAKTLRVLKSERLASDSFFPDTYMEQIENLLLKITEKTLNDLGKSISGTQWLRRVGKLPKIPEPTVGEEVSTASSTQAQFTQSTQLSNYICKFQSFNRFYMSFSELGAYVKSGLCASDSALLSVYRNTGIVCPLWNWSKDDSVEQLLLCLNQHLFPIISYLFPNNNMQFHLINCYLNSVMGPLNKILTISNHYTYLSNSTLEKFILKTLNITESEAGGLKINTQSASDSLSTSSFSKLTTNEQPTSAQHNSFDAHDQLVELGLVKGQALERDFGSTTWCISDQPSRIYILLLSSLLPLSLQPGDFKSANKVIWEFFQHNKFFSIKRMAFGPYPVSNSSKSSSHAGLPLPDQFISAVLSSSMYKWKPLFRMSVSAEREKFLDLLTKLGTSTTTTLFSNKAHESLQKAMILRRLSTLIWAGSKDQFMPNFPAIQERIVELIKNSAYKNVIIEVYLLLRVVMYKMGPDRISSMWPVIITEISKALSSTLDFDRISADRADFGTVNVLLACCKFLDLLLVYEIPEFLVHKSTFVSDLNCSDVSPSTPLASSPARKSMSPNSFSPSKDIFTRSRIGCDDNISEYDSKLFNGGVRGDETDKILKTEFESSSKKVCLNTGLLDQLGNHFLTLSSLNRGNSLFDNSSTHARSPGGSSENKSPAFAKSNSATKNTLDKKSPSVNYLNNFSAKPSRSGINGLDQANQDTTSYSYIHLFASNKAKDLPLRRPLIAESYIYSPFQLLPFLCNVSQHDYRMALEKSVPDASYIESIIMQDLMVFYDISAVVQSASPYSASSSLNTGPSSDKRALKTFHNDSNPPCSLIEVMQEEEGFF